MLLNGPNAPINYESGDRQLRFILNDTICKAPPYSVIFYQSYAYLKSDIDNNNNSHIRVKVFVNEQNKKLMNKLECNIIDRYWLLKCDIEVVIGKDNDKIISMLERINVNHRVYNFIVKFRCPSSHYQKVFNIIP